jgi:hypothetical protein
MTNEQAQLKLIANLQKIKEGKVFFYNLGQYLSLGLVEWKGKEVVISAKGLRILEVAMV